MDIKPILSQIFPYLLPVVTVLLFTILLLMLNEKEYSKYLTLKNSFCDKNQLMEFENTVTKESNAKMIYVLFATVIGLSLCSFIIAFLLEKDILTVITPVIIAVVSLIIIIVIPTTQYSKPDYTTVIDRITRMLGNTNFINLTSDAATANKSYFDSSEKRLVDLKRSIVDKYTAYKEEQNKNNYYVRSDIEEELKNVFANKTSPKAFATELVKYMNFPHDAKLLNQAYEQWQQTDTTCGNAINITNSTTASLDNKNAVAAKYKECTLKVPTTVPYTKDTQKEAPLYLTWLLLIILFYYFVHPLYQSHKFYLVLAIIIVMVVFMFYYVMTVRNNI